MLERETATALEAVEHLVGLQAQNTLPPYVALWSRLKGFEREELSSLLRRHEVVRLALQRSTIHLVSARDCLALRPAMQSAIDRSFFTGSPFGRRVKHLDREEVTKAARALFDAQPRSTAEAGKALAKQFPDADAEALGNAARTYLALVQLPPRGIWGEGGRPVVDTAENVLGRPLKAASLDAIALRYLAAFGPATPRDAQAWCGVQGFDEVFERLREKLKTFHDEKGRELFDLPSSPRPDPATPAPPRFLGEFDNVGLAHQDRSRMLREGETQFLFAPEGGIKCVALVDGVLNAAWWVEKEKSGATLLIEPMADLPKVQLAALRDEGERLLGFLEPEAKQRHVELR